MSKLKTRAEFIKAIPKKFHGIEKLYKLRDCTKSELVEGYKTGDFPDRVKRAKVTKKEKPRSNSRKNTTTNTSSASYSFPSASAGLDPSIFENNPAFPPPPNFSNISDESTGTKIPYSSVKSNNSLKQTIELECENSETKEITPDEFKRITGMDINEINEINRTHQETRAMKQMQNIVVNELNKLREMEMLCSQAIEASIKLQNIAKDLKNTARLAEHKEYSEVCENIAHVFGNRLASARTIHMDLCMRRDIPVPKVSYKPDNRTVDMVRILNKMRREYDFTHDKSIDSRYKNKETTDYINEDSNKYKKKRHINGVTVEDVTDSMPTAAI
jgi:hypothetical protein